MLYHCSFCLYKHNSLTESLMSATCVNSLQHLEICKWMELAAAFFFPPISICFNELSVSDDQLWELSKSTRFEFGYSFLYFGTIFRRRQFNKAFCKLHLSSPNQWHFLWLSFWNLHNWWNVFDVYKISVTQPLINFSTTDILKGNKKISNSYFVLIFICWKN